MDGELLLKGLVASPDGQRIYRTERSGKVWLGTLRSLQGIFSSLFQVFFKCFSMLFRSEAVEIGRDAGLEIRKEAGEAFFQEMQARRALLE